MKSLLNVAAALAITVAIMSAFTSSSAQAESTDHYFASAQALVDDYVRAGLFSGAVLVARDGKVVFRRGFGAANREWAIPNTPDTRFRIGSITKQFTAAAVLRLVDAKKIALDDAIGLYVTNLPPRWQAVTIRQLLGHTSGIPSYTALDDFDDILFRLRHTPRQIIDLVRDVPFDFEPGTNFQYDNTGYILLGCLIEAVSGLAYQDYLDQQLLKPLGLRHAAYDDGRTILANAAQPYTDVSEGGDSVKHAAPVDMSNAYAAGALVASVDDLLAWQQQLMHGKVLSADSTAAMFRDAGHGYGMGWFIRRRFGRPVVEHAGTLPGFDTVLAYYPDDKLTVIVLGNYGGDVVDKIAVELAGLALGVPAAHTVASVDDRLFARLVGRYQLTPDLIFTIERKGAHLFARLSGQQQFEIYPEGQYAYFYKALDAQLTFDASNSAAAGYLILHQNGALRKALRID